jgi:TolB-like protein/Flp pilus assembly protein TadD
MPTVLQRLKERKIVQWAVVYLAGAWLFLEALGFVADNFGWPTFITRSAIVLAAVGFFAALVLAWYHGEKGRQRASGVELLILAGILVIAGAAVALLGRGPQGEVAGVLPAVVRVPVNEKSVAVLPFVNIGGDPENVTFTDGVTVDIINHLSNIADLKVISRTSAFQYRETEKGLREIAAELGVAHVVEGEVQRAGDRVRVNAQLIDARTDEHIWSEQYNRELTDVFEVQSDIAEKIAVGLRATLTVAERGRIGQAPTDNLEAYGHYVRAIELLERGELEENWRLALQLAEQAVELDPQFAQAWALQSELHSLLCAYSHDRSEERLGMAQSTALQSFELRPDLGEAHRALGLYYYYGLRDYERALEQFSVALKTIPSDARTWNGIASVQRRQGRWQESLENRKKAFELSPRSAYLAGYLGDAYALMRRYAEAEVIYDRAISLYPDPANFECKAWLYLEWQGDTEKAKTVLQEQSLRVGSLDARRIGYRAQPFIELFERKYPEALQRLSSATYDVDYPPYFVPKPLLYAQIYGLMGHAERELAYYDSARAILEAELRGNMEDHRLHSSLGIAYAGLGRRDEAIREAKLGVELMPVERDAFYGIYRVEDLARVCVMVGEYDAAIDQLDYLLSIPGEISVPLLRIDPTWDLLRDHPRFQATLAKYE